MSSRPPTDLDRPAGASADPADVAWELPPPAPAPIVNPWGTPDDIPDNPWQGDASASGPAAASTSSPTGAPPVSAAPPPPSAPPPSAPPPPLSTAWSHEPPPSQTWSTPELQQPPGEIPVNELPPTDLPNTELPNLELTNLQLPNAEVVGDPGDPEIAVRGRGSPGRDQPPGSSAPPYSDDPAHAHDDSRPYSTVPPSFNPYRFGEAEAPIDPSLEDYRFGRTDDLVLPAPRVYPPSAVGAEVVRGSSPRFSIKAIIGMLLGIAALPLCFLNFFDAFIIAPAVVLCLLGLRETRDGRSGRAMAITGLIFSAVAAVAALVFVVFVVSRASSCADLWPRGSTQYNSCLITGH